MRYLILTCNVCNTGGAQLYVARRAQWLKNKGYSVEIITYFDNGNFILEPLFKDFSVINCDKLSESPGCYSLKKVDRILNEICTHFSTERYVIESHDLKLTIWGELIAQRIRAKHLAYILAEPSINSCCFPFENKIICTKYNKDEFFGVSSVSLDKIFGKVCKKNYVNVGFDEKELALNSIPSVGYRKDKSTYVIGTITRLDKTYVEPLILASCELARKYPSQKFHLLIAGGSKTKGREEYLFSKYTTAQIGIPNFSLSFSGYINQLGIDLFQQMDLFIGMGTASINAISQRCLTLNIQPPENLCSGFFGVDTTNFAYTENNTLYQIFDKIEEAYLLDEKTRVKYVQIGRKLYEDEFECTSCFTKLDTIVGKLKDVEQYDILPNEILHNFCSVGFNFLRRIKYTIKK